MRGYAAAAVAAGAPFVKPSVTGAFVLASVKLLSTDLHVHVHVSRFRMYTFVFLIL